MIIEPLDIKKTFKNPEITLSERLKDPIVYLTTKNFRFQITTETCEWGQSIA